MGKTEESTNRPHANVSCRLNGGFRLDVTTTPNKARRVFLLRMFAVKKPKNRSAAFASGGEHGGQFRGQACECSWLFEGDDFSAHAFSSS
jgi:hypothetical protein